MTNIAQGKFLIKGDFLIDESFTFQNSIIEIKTGFQITIAQSVPNTSPIGLWLVNSKLFACQGLWKGIFMSPGTVVVTSSNTQIEDAEVAIKAHSDYVTIGCENTTFNRNGIGISINGGPGKNVALFKSNTFSCTSPLNGAGGITFAGVELINNTISLNSGPSTKSVFKDLIYGVHCSGSTSVLSARFLKFERIRNNAVYMEKGTLNLASSEFFNPYQVAVYMKKADQAFVLGNRFTFSSAIPFVNDQFRHTRVRIAAFNLNSEVQVNDNRFDVGFSNSTHDFTGIRFDGGDIGSGSLIMASSNLFSTWFDLGYGIELVGEFPLASNTLVFGNQFFMGTGPSTSGFNSGIYAHAGTKNNLKIFNNEFTGNFSYYLAHQGIGLQGPSSGEFNHVVNNFLDRSQGQLPLMLRLSHGFENAQICGNYLNNVTHRDYLVSGMNSGTDFSKNYMDFNGELVISPMGLIGPQFHRGNKFFNANINIGAILARAECEDVLDGPNNLFTVHTQRSNVGNNFFSPYHPEIVIPAPDGDFFRLKTDGSPFEGDCSFDFINFQEDDEETAFVVPMDGMVANNEIFIHPENFSGQFRLNRYLFKKLKNHPELVGMDNSFPSFLSGLQGTNLEKLYQVERGIDMALNASATQEVTSETALAEIKQNINSINDIDSILQSTVFGSTTWNGLVAQKNTITDSITTRTGQYDAIVSVYAQERNQKLNVAKTLNASISSTVGWENYEKTINDIRIDKLINGTLTEAQISTLSGIAVLCPEVAGYAASIAQGLLPDCVLQALTLCEGGDLEEETEVSLPQALTLPPNNTTASVSGSLFPNPVTGSEFNISAESPGKVYVHDISGRVMLTAEFQEKTVSIQHGLENGLYFVTIIGEGGEKTVDKMVVQKL